jgi:glutamyl-tRNA reductase
MHSSAKVDHVINVRVTHRTARVPLLEAVRFKEREKALAEVRALENVEECLILQTCNRIEIYVVSEEEKRTVNLVKDYFVRNASANAEEVLKAIETSTDEKTFDHLLRVTSGLESMVIGEDQVLNQVWDAYLAAENAKTVGPILNHLFNRAMTVGRRVREETGLNKGAVSIGSATVELAVNLLGSLDDKKILVMGAGEIGTLVAKALAHRCHNPIFIANRTHARAVKLAEDLSGKAVMFDQFEEVLVDADVVICSTSAPHYLLTKEMVSRQIKHRSTKNDLLIIDISNPRNVEKACQEVACVKLHNIDDLESIANRNKKEREKNIDKAVQLLDKEIATLNGDMKSLSVRMIISSLLSRAEQVRQKELATALGMMGNVDEKERKVLEDLTSILLKQTFVPIVENLRVAAKKGDMETVEIAVKLFERTGKN